MTEQELQAIEERWTKATPGPWWAVESIIRPSGRPNEMAICEFNLRKAHNIYFQYDQIAIAHAPTDISALLAEVRRLNRMVGKALPLLSEDGREVICPAMRNYWDNDCDFGCRVREKYLECWRKYLQEGEAD